VVDPEPLDPLELLDPDAAFDVVEAVSDEDDFESDDELDSVFSLEEVLDEDDRRLSVA
jgi:hypothetical protein